MIGLEKAALKKKITLLKKTIEEKQLDLFIVLSFLIAAFLRVWQLDKMPPGVSEKELVIIERLKSYFDNGFSVGPDITHSFFEFLSYIWAKIFGLTVLNIRILTAVIGIATIISLFYFIKSWFSKKVAIFTTVLISFSAFQIAVSRVISYQSLTPLFFLLIFLLLTYSYRTKNSWLFGFSGFFVGLSLYVDKIFLLLAILFLVSGLYFVKLNKKFFTSYRKEIVVAGFGFLAAIIPQILFFMKNPQALTSNYFNLDFNSYLYNLSEVVKMLFVKGKADYFSNLGTEPILDPLIAVTAILGLIYSIYHYKRRKYFFLNSWLLIFVFYVVATTDLSQISLYPIFPVFFVYSALILDYTTAEWMKTFPLNKKAQFLAIFLISLFITFSIAYNFQRYFIAYKNSTEVKKEFSSQSLIPIKKGE